MTTIDRIIHIVGAHAPRHAVAADTRLDALELDSLECVQLTVDVEDHFDVEIGCGERVSFETPACIARLVDQRLAERLPLAA